MQWLLHENALMVVGGFVRMISYYSQGLQRLKILTHPMPASMIPNSGYLSM